MVGGQASLPPWLKPQADATEDPAENAAEDVAAAPAEDVAAVRYIDNTKDATTEVAAAAPDDAAAAQKAYEEYLKLCYTNGYGTSGGYSGYSGSYSLPTGMA